MYRYTLLTAVNTRTAMTLSALILLLFFTYVTTAMLV